MSLHLTAVKVDERSPPNMCLHLSVKVPPLSHSLSLSLSLSLCTVCVGCRDEVSQSKLHILVITEVNCMLLTLDN